MSKKTNKAAPKEVSSYAQRDIVLGKVRGFPPWPGMVVDPDSAPEIVQSERPFKRTNFYCVQFFPAGDYAWLLAKDISKLQTHEIESYINEPYKKSGDLLQGYRTALDPTAWEASRAAALASAAAAAAAAAADDEDAEAEAEAEGEAEEVDELDTDHEAGEGKKKPKNRKRKRESDSAAITGGANAAGGGKTRKPPKEKKEKQKKAPAKPRKSGAKTKALVESEDERAQEEEEEGAEDAEGEDAGPSKKTSPPPAKKARRDRAGDKEKEDDPEDAKMQADPEALKVREWRHRLQKAFLSSKTTPDDADMPALDVLFSTVESYHAITVAYLQFSKIGKVMRHITLLPEDRVPRDAEFRFRERARALVERWQLVLGAGRGGEGAAATKVVLGGENGKEVNGKEEMKVNGMGAGVSPTQDTKEVTAGAAAIDLNGHADAGAGSVPAEVDAQDEADAQGQADAQGEVEVDAPAEVDVAMVEA